MSEGRLVVVGPNPAIEATFFCDRLAVNSQNDADCKVTLGGKGVNVARIAKTLGSDPILLTCLDPTIGSSIAALLSRSEVRVEFVRHFRGIRVSSVIYERGEPTPTVIRSDGPALSAHEQAEYFNIADRIITPDSIVCVSGSLPGGFSADLIASICRLCRDRRARVLVDASGAPLAAALRSEPYLIKVNQSEIYSAFDKTTDLRTILASVTAQGVRNVIVTLGRKGWVANIAGEYLQAVIEPNPDGFDIGAGDAMMAALAHALSNGSHLAESMEFATKIAAASTYCRSAGEVVLDSDLNRGPLVIRPWQ